MGPRCTSTCTCSAYTLVYVQRRTSSYWAEHSRSSLRHSVTHDFRCSRRASGQQFRLCASLRHRAPWLRSQRRTRSSACPCRCARRAASRPCPTPCSREIRRTLVHGPMPVTIRRLRAGSTIPVRAHSHDASARAENFPSFARRFPLLIFTARVCAPARQFHRPNLRAIVN